MSTNSLKGKALVTSSAKCGNDVGQIAICEFILAEYGSELSDNLEKFLRKVLQSSYENMGGFVGRPPEDVALDVAKIMEARL